MSNTREHLSSSIYFALLVLCLLLLAVHSNAVAETTVATRSYDNYRTGANTSETVFTPDRVRLLGMTKLFSLSLDNDDPRVEAQPLYVPGLMMEDQRKHDVLFLSSMANNVYAFDLNSSEKLWSTSLGTPFKPDPSDPVDIHHINKSFGILSTPVIDQDEGLIYLVNWILDERGNRALRVNALQLSDGKPPTNRQALPITASMRNASGQVIALDQVQKQRAALLLNPLRSSPEVHKILYVAFTGQDTPPAEPDPTKAHHGWIVAFDVSSWQQVGSWVSTPSSFGGGIWQGSAGLAADDGGNIYAMTSNGGFLPVPGHPTRDFVGTTDFPESFVKLRYDSGTTGAGLKLTDWFSPFRDSERKTWQDSEVAPFPRGYNYEDQDLGSAGPLLPPGTNLLLGAGKDGVLYVLDRNNLGKAVGDFSKLKAPPNFITFDPDQSIPAYTNASPEGNLDFKPSLGVKTHHLHSPPVYWKSSTVGAMLFVWGENSPMRAFLLDVAGHAKLLATGPDIASSALADPSKPNLGGMPGGMLTLSSDAGNNGIVWATAPIDGDANMMPVPGAVRAYDAANFDSASSPSGPKKLRRLWEQRGFTYSKFCPPVVADGRLIVPTYDGRIDVYVLNDVRPAEAARP
jgi:outer membrane protein assembly factor BamB